MIVAGETLRLDCFGGSDIVASEPEKVWLHLEEPDGTQRISWHHADEGDDLAVERWDIRGVDA